MMELMHMLIGIFVVCIYMYAVEQCFGDERRIIGATS